MCKFKLFSIAAAALMMVACSNEDLTQQTQTKAGKMQFSATIAAPVPPPSLVTSLAPLTMLMLDWFIPQHVWEQSPVVMMALNILLMKLLKAN